MWIWNVRSYFPWLSHLPHAKIPAGINYIVKPLWYLTNYEFDGLYWECIYIYINFKFKYIYMLNLKFKKMMEIILGHEDLFVLTLFWVLRVVKETQGKKMKMNLQGWRNKVFLFLTTWDRWHFSTCHSERVFVEEWAHPLLMVNFKALFMAEELLSCLLTCPRFLLLYSSHQRNIYLELMKVSSCS